MGVERPASTYFTFRGVREQGTSLTHGLIDF